MADAILYDAAAWVGNLVLSWGAATATATFAYYATMVVGYAVIIGGSLAYQNAQRQRAARGLSGVDQSRSIMVRNSVEIRNAAVYGKDCLSGPVAYWKKTGSGSSEYHYFVVILNADHPLTSIDTVRWGDTELTLDEGGAVTNTGLSGYLWITKHLGAMDQAADAALMAASGGEWTADHRLQGIPYLVVKMKWDATVFPNGLENVSAIIHGKAVYDLRDDDQDMDDPDTWLWSENSALCAADYLHGELGAAYGTEINDDELIASANNSDEYIELICLPGTEKRYRTNGPVSSGDTPETIINQLCGAMAGTCVFSGGEWFVLSGMWREPSMSALTVDDLLGQVSANLNLSRKDLCNTVTGTFLSPADGYAPIAFKPYKSVAALAEDDGKVLTQDIALPLTNSNSAAQRLAKIYCQRIRRQATVMLTVNLKAMQCRGGDVIPFTYAPNYWTAATFEVAEWKLNLPTEEKNPMHSVSLTLRKTDAGIWDWNPATDEQCADDVPTPGNRAPGQWSAPQIPPSSPGGGGDPGHYPDLTGTLPSGAVYGFPECRMKSGSGSFCGFVEKAGHVSDPPRFYKKRTLAGTLTMKVYNNADCDDGGGPSSGHLDAPELNLGGADITNGYADWERIDDWTVRITGHCTSGGGAPNLLITGSVNHAGAPIATNLNNGDHVDIDLHAFSDTCPVTIWVTVRRYNFGWVTGASSEVATLCHDLNYCVSELVDVWDLTQDYGPHLADVPPLCMIAQTDYSTKTLNGVLQGGGPDLSDFPEGFLSVVSSTATLYELAGSESCIETGASPLRYTKVTGTLTETLDEEDMIEDVIKRAMTETSPPYASYDSILDVPDAELDSVADCAAANNHGCCDAYISLRTGAEQKDVFIRESKVKGHAMPADLIEGHDYVLTIYYTRRNYGTGDFVTFSNQTKDFTASADDCAKGYVTPLWYRLPNDDGFETIVDRIEVEDVTA